MTHDQINAALAKWESDHEAAGDNAEIEQEAADAKGNTRRAELYAFEAFSQHAAASHARDFVRFLFARYPEAQG
jgi:hypothetical protein